VGDTNIEAGEIVRFTGAGEGVSDQVKTQLENLDEDLIMTRAGGDGRENDPDSIGVISTRPGLYLKQWETEGMTEEQIALRERHSRPVALVGRVPVKVTSEAGAIERGDYITASSKAGYGMKANSAGMVVGRALEDLPAGEGEYREGKVMMYVDLGYVSREELERREFLKGSLNVTDEGDNQTFTALYEVIENPEGRVMKVNAGLQTEQLYTRKIQATEGNDLAIKLSETKQVDGQSVASAFRILDSGNNEVFAIDADGKISIKTGEGSSVGSYELLPLGVEPESTNVESGSETDQNTTEQSPQLTGIQLEDGSIEYFVPTRAVTENSEILISLSENYEYVQESKTDGEGFTIKFMQEPAEPLKISYLIFN
jgi:hypothetical protein